MRKVDLGRIDGGSDPDNRGKSGQVMSELGINDKTPNKRRDHQARRYPAKRLRLAGKVLDWSEERIESWAQYVDSYSIPVLERTVKSFETRAVKKLSEMPRSRKKFT